MSNTQKYSLNDSFLSRFISLSLVVPTLAAQANMHGSIGVSRADSKHTSESSLQVPKMNPVLSVSNTYRQYAENAAGDQGGSTTSLSAMMPIAYMSNSMILADAKLDLARNPSDTTANIGLIYRKAFGEALVGAYGYFDFLQSSSENNYNTFSQVTLGSEYAKQDWAGRINVYVPFSTDVKDTGQRNLAVEANPADDSEFSIYYNVLGQQARSGFDAEVSYTKAVSQTVDIELSAGGYHYPKSNDQDAVTGPRLRADISNSSAVGRNVMKTAIKTEYQSDSLRGSQVNIGLGVSYGGSSAHSGKSTYASNLWSRPVRRDLNSLFVTEGVSGTEAVTGANGSLLSKLKTLAPGSELGKLTANTDKVTAQLLTGSYTVEQGAILNNGGVSGTLAGLADYLGLESQTLLASHPLLAAFIARHGGEIDSATISVVPSTSGGQKQSTQLEDVTLSTSEPSYTYAVGLTGNQVGGTTFNNTSVTGVDFLYGATDFTWIGSRNAGIDGGSFGALIIQQSSDSTRLSGLTLTGGATSAPAVVVSGDATATVNDTTISSESTEGLINYGRLTVPSGGTLTVSTSGENATSFVSSDGSALNLSGATINATSEAGTVFSVSNTSGDIDFGNAPSTLILTQNSTSDSPALALNASRDITIDDVFTIQAQGPAISASGENISIAFEAGSNLSGTGSLIETTGKTTLTISGSTNFKVGNNSFGIATAGDLTIDSGDNAFSLALNGSNSTAFDFSNTTSLSTTDGMSITIGGKSTGATGIKASNNADSLLISNIDFVVKTGAQDWTLIDLANDDNTEIGSHSITINEGNSPGTLFRVQNPGTGTKIQIDNSINLPNNPGTTVFDTDDSLNDVITGDWDGTVNIGEDSQVVNWSDTSYPAVGFPIINATLGSGSTFITMPNIATTSDDVNAQFSGANGLTLTPSSDYTGILLNLDIESAATTESENSTVTLKGNYTFSGPTTGVVTGLGINNQKQVLIEASLASSNFAGATGSNAIKVTGQNSDSGVTIAPASGNSVDLTVGDNTTGITVEGSKVQLDTTAGGIKVSAQDMQAVMLQNGSVPVTGYLLNSPYDADANTLELSNSGSTPVLTLDNLTCECLTSCTSGNNPLRLEGKINITNTGSAAAIEHFIGSDTARSEQLVVQGLINLTAGAATAVNSDAIDLYLIAENDSSITTNGSNAKNFTGISTKESGPTSAPIEQQVAIVPNGVVEVRNGDVVVGGQTVNYSTVAYIPDTGDDIVGTWNLVANGSGSNALSSETTAEGSTITTQVRRAFIQAEDGVAISGSDLDLTGGIRVRDSVVYSTGTGTDNYALSIDGTDSTAGIYKVSGTTSTDDYTNIFLSKGINAVRVKNATGKTINFEDTFIGTNFDLQSGGANFSQFADRADLTKNINNFEKRAGVLDASALTATNTSKSAALTLDSSPNIVIGNALLVSRYNNASVVSFDGMDIATARTIMGTQDNTDSAGNTDPTGVNGAMVMTGDNSHIASFYDNSVRNRLTFTLNKGTYATEGVGSPVADTTTVNFQIGETSASDNEEGAPMPLADGNFSILTKQSDAIRINNIEKAYNANDPTTGVLDLSNTVLKAGLRGGAGIFTQTGNSVDTFAGADGADDISAVRIRNIAVTAAAEAGLVNDTLLEIKLDNASLAANSNTSVLNITDITGKQGSSLVISASTEAANIQANTCNPSNSTCSTGNSYGIQLNIAGIDRGDTYPYATSSATIADMPKLDGTFKFMNIGSGAGLQLINQTPTGTPIAGNMVQGHLMSDNSLLEMELHDGATGINIKGVNGVEANSVKLFDVSPSGTDEQRTMKFKLHGNNTKAIVVEDSSNIGVTGNYQINSGVSDSGVVATGQVGIHVKNSDKVQLESSDGLLDIALDGRDSSVVGRLPSPTVSAGVVENLGNTTTGAYILLNTTGDDAAGIVIEGLTGSTTKTNATIAGDLLVATNNVPAIKITGADYSTTADGLFKPSSYSAGSDTDHTVQDIFLTSNKSSVISVSDSTGYSSDAVTSLTANEHGAMTTIRHNRAGDGASAGSAIEISDSSNFGLDFKPSASSMARLNIETFNGSDGAIKVTDSDGFKIATAADSTLFTITENGSDGVVGADTMLISGGTTPSISGIVEVETVGVKGLGKSVLSLVGIDQSADNSIDISGLNLTATDLSSTYTSAELGTVEAAGTGGAVLSLSNIGSDTDGTARTLTLPTMTITGYGSFISASGLTDSNLVGNQETSATTALADAVGVSISDSSNTSWDTGFSADISTSSDYQWVMNGAGSTAVSVSGGTDVSLTGDIATQIGTDATGLSITSVAYSIKPGPFTSTPSLKIHGVATPTPTSASDFSKSSQGLVISGLTSTFDATVDSDSDGDLKDAVTVALGASSITSVANPIMVSDFDRLYFTLGDATGTASTIQSNAVSVTTADDAPWAQTQSDETVYGVLFKGKPFDGLGHTVSQLGVQFVNTELQYDNEDAAPTVLNDTNAVVLGIQQAKPIERFPAAGSATLPADLTEISHPLLEMTSSRVVVGRDSDEGLDTIFNTGITGVEIKGVKYAAGVAGTRDTRPTSNIGSPKYPTLVQFDSDSEIFIKRETKTLKDNIGFALRNSKNLSSDIELNSIVIDNGSFFVDEAKPVHTAPAGSSFATSASYMGSSSSPERWTHSMTGLVIENQAGSTDSVGEIHLHDTVIDSKKAESSVSVINVSGLTLNIEDSTVGADIDGSTLDTGHPYIDASQAGIDVYGLTGNSTISLEGSTVRGKSGIIVHDSSDTADLTVALDSGSTLFAAGSIQSSNEDSGVITTAGLLVDNVAVDLSIDSGGKVETFGVGLGSGNVEVTDATYTSIPDVVHYTNAAIGTVTNNGDINVNHTGGTGIALTDNASVTLAGSGSINTKADNTTAITVDSTSTLTDGASMPAINVSGSGSIGIQSSGTINATNGSTVNIAASASSTPDSAIFVEAGTATFKTTNVNQLSGTGTFTNGLKITGGQTIIGDGTTGTLTVDSATTGVNIDYTDATISDSKPLFVLASGATQMLGWSIPSSVDTGLNVEGISGNTSSASPITMQPFDLGAGETKIGKVNDGVAGNGITMTNVNSSELSLGIINVYADNNAVSLQNDSSNYNPMVLALGKAGTSAAVSSSSFNSTTVSGNAIYANQSSADFRLFNNRDGAHNLNVGSISAANNAVVQFSTHQNNGVRYNVETGFPTNIGETTKVSLVGDLSVDSCSRIVFRQNSGVVLGSNPAFVVTQFNNLANADREYQNIVQVGGRDPNTPSASASATTITTSDRLPQIINVEIDEDFSTSDETCS